MIEEYIAEELNISLLFLDNLRTIEIWELDGPKKARLAIWTKLERTPMKESEDFLFAYDSVLSNGTGEFAWRIVWTQCSKEEAKSRLGGESTNYIFEKHKLQFDVRLAYPLSSDEYASGRLFTFLPLPSKTNFPAHIHALFAVTPSRQGLRNSDERLVPGSEDEYVIVPFSGCLLNHCLVFLLSGITCFLMSIFHKHGATS